MEYWDLWSTLTTLKPETDSKEALDIRDNTRNAEKDDGPRSGKR